MINIDRARVNRSVRYNSQTHVDKVNMLPGRIAERLTGLNYDDMTTAEKQIADLLGHEGFLFFDENGDCKGM